MHKNHRNTVAVIALLLLVGFVMGAVVCLFFFVPVRELPNAEFERTEAMNPGQMDVTTERAIRRAKLDYFFYPVDFRSPRELVFKEARVVSPNDLYLVFYLKKDPADFLIFYRVGRENGRLLWKAGVSTGG